MEITIAVNSRTVRTTHSGAGDEYDLKPIAYSVLKFHALQNLPTKHEPETTHGTKLMGFRRANWLSGRQAFTCFHSWQDPVEFFPVKAHFL